VSPRDRVGVIEPLGEHDYWLVKSLLPNLTDTTPAVVTKLATDEYDRRIAKGGGPSDENHETLPTNSR
jgi:hypothetical protein